jgi:protein-L-isoaspartate O-methyltransferase
MLTATYSPEDNKLRLYADSRLPRDLYDRVKAAGFIWAPKQALFVAPAWTPAREDLLVELCGEIGDEDTGLVERAEERADRFEDYRDKRAQDAEGARAAVERIADGIPLGQPILVGHHSERHARKDAERIENGMRKAVKMWETSQYWTDRAAGAIRHAKYRERPDVRARRIKGLEAEQRKQQKAKKRAEAFLSAWLADGLTLERAKAIANYGSGEVTLPDGSKCWSAWSALNDGKITPEEARDQCAEHNRRTIAGCVRWLAHIENRLAYERAMMQESGGIAADKVKPEKGGACKCWVDRGRWIEIQKVNRVSVTVLDNWGNGGPDFTRTIPFDQLTALLSRADFEALKAGRAKPPIEVPQRRTNHEPARTLFDDMADALKTGVKVVSAPQLFPTPADLAARVVELAEIEPGHDVLEPSAGTGNILAACFHLNGPGFTGTPPSGKTVAVEINATLTEHLRQEYPQADVRCADFLACNGELGTFDRIVMNPPFANRADIRHIEHARGKLKPGGRLVAICANGPRQREKLQPLATAWIDLPAGSFAEQGTSVNAAIVVIDA